jgi:hypothetical protein
MPGDAAAAAAVQGFATHLLDFYGYD